MPGGLPGAAGEIAFAMWMCAFPTGKALSVACPFTTRFERGWARAGLVLIRPGRPALSSGGAACRPGAGAQMVRWRTSGIPPRSHCKPTVSPPSPGYLPPSAGRNSCCLRAPKPGY